MIEKIFYALFLVLLISCTNKTSNLQSKDKIRVAVFGGNGASVTCILETMESLKIDVGIQSSVIQSYQIQNGDLDNFDVIIFPGGSGSKELLNLGKSVAAKVKEFAHTKGKGVVGICAGGYLLSKTKGYPSLELASTSVTDRAHYNRGRGLVEFEINEKGAEVFPELKNQSLFLQYYDGPVLIPVGETMEYTELATYKSDIHPDDFAPAGITPGKTFILEEKIGEGNLMIVVGHPESTPGMRWMVPRMARHVAGAELISYNEKWIRPEINDSAIIFDAELKKYEKDNFWKLFENDPQVQIQAMDNLFALRSRPAVRYNVGLLRDDKPEVRKHAAFLLMQTEYTDALKDLHQAYIVEKNSTTKEQLQKTIEFLTTLK